MVIEQKWACGHCRTIHDSEDGADDCCPSTKVWMCSKCGDYSYGKQDFCNVCGKEETNLGGS